MNNENQVPKRNISIAAAVAMLCVGSIALLISRIKGQKKAKARAEAEELNKSLTE